MNIIYKQDILEKTITFLINKINNKYPQFLTDVYNYIEECALKGDTSALFSKQRTNEGYLIKFNKDIVHLIESNYYCDWHQLLTYTEFTTDFYSNQTTIRISWYN